MPSLRKIRRVVLQTLFGFTLIPFVVLQETSAERGKDPWWENKYPPQPYAYGYKITDDDGNQQWKREISNGHVVRGSYGFTGPDGLFRQVDYIADENGYRAIIRTNEPGTDAQNPASVTLYANPPVNPQNVGFSQRGDQAQSSSSARSKAARHINKRIGYSTAEEDSWQTANLNSDVEMDDAWRNSKGDAISTDESWKHKRHQDTVARAENENDRSTTSENDSWNDKHHSTSTDLYEPWRRHGIWRNRKIPSASSTWGSRVATPNSEKLLRKLNIKKSSEVKLPHGTFWDDDREEDDDHQASHDIDITPTPNSLDKLPDEDDLSKVSKAEWDDNGDHSTSSTKELGWASSTEENPTVSPLKRIWDFHTRGISGKARENHEPNSETSSSSVSHRKYLRHQGPLFVSKYVWE